MRPSTAIAVLLWVIPTISLGQARDLEATNVLSYYAVDNSLDGQPLIDQNNLMRFYPVFAFRDSIQRVQVNVYHGPNVFSRPADRMDNGRFWQVKLPEFALGEAIQRFEVEMTIGLDDPARQQADSMRFALERVKTRTDSVLDVLRTLGVRERALAASADTLGKRLDRANSAWASTSVAVTRVQGVRNEIDSSAVTLSRLQTELVTLLEDVSRITHSDTDLDSADIEALRIHNDSLRKLLVLLSARTSILDSSLSNVSDAYQKHQLDSHIVSRLASTLSGRVSQTQIISEYRDAVGTWIKLMDTLQSEVRERLSAKLIDTTLMGPGIRKSDIIIDDSLRSARILYRNYKHSLRRLPALDPAERMGVFRARYVPFAVVGDSLMTPFDGAGYEPVFEIGLTFGNAIVSGDDFVVPEFSLRRLGVAFAITSRLFSGDARVSALAFTYDFNSYGSIAVGANFSDKAGVKPYYSFGINKKAFEDLIGEIQRLFE